MPVWSTGSNLVDLLSARAASDPAGSAYAFLADGESREARVTYGELHRSAQATGSRLLEGSAAGERALLLFPPGLDYIRALWGCLYAGVIAVPAYPPRRNRSVVRLQSIIADCQPTLVLTTPELASSADRLVGLVPELARMRLATDQIDQASDGTWIGPSLRPRTIALLQYTSGSTASPKGVMVSHGNLLHNLGLIERLTGATEKDLSVIWLPPYHDMGLIGGILQPLYTGYTAVLMSPAAFIQRPARWLEAITRYHATISGGPNFAYELCVHAVTQKDRERLDLSSWRLAFNGAEPVRHETMESFSAAFASQRFRREVFYPCYGLAEATLMVTGSRTSEPARVLAVDPELLGMHRVKPSSDPTGTRLVGCGRSAAEQEIRIVDPGSVHQCAPGTVGEIWVRGPSVALGYWGHQEETAAVFGARLADSDEGPFLRTGDLGVLDAGELYVTGRIKDLIIIRGRNHYPHDIEQTAARAHPALRQGCSAAFSVDRDGEERLVIVQEIGRRAAQAHVEDIAEAIRLAVAAEHELRVDSVVLVPQGAVPKTSSGKIQRLACRASYLASTLSVLAVSGAEEKTPLTVTDPAGGEEDPGADAVAPLDAPRSAAQLEAWLRSQAALAMDVPVTRVDGRPLAALGLDSLRASRLSGLIQSVLGLHIAPVRLLEGIGIETLTADVLTGLAAPDGVPDLTQPRGPAVPPGEATPPPLSPMQEAIWFFQRLYADSVAYNLPIALRITGPLDPVVLQDALQSFLQRHEVLRTVFPVVDERPVQRVEETVSLRLAETDLSGLSPRPQEMQVAGMIKQEVTTPFDLTAGPLVRARLIRLTRDECLLVLVTHHIVADGASAGLLVKELGSLYDAHARGLPEWLPPLPMQYADWSRRSRDRLGSAEAGAQLSWWCEQLRGIPVLNIPTDRARPARLSHRAEVHRFEVPAEIADGLRALARDEGATLFMVVLAAFQVLLGRWSSESDVAVGTPVSIRDGLDTTGLVGFFVNTVMLRVKVASGESFRTLLRQVRTVALEAYARRDLPFDRIVQALHPERDLSRNPLFQVMLAFEGAPVGPVKVGGVMFTPEPVPVGASVMDLTLHIWEHPGSALTVSLEYAADLFDRATLERLAAHYATLLAGIATDPERRVAELPMLTRAERRQVLVEWNGTAVVEPTAPSLHQLFEAQAVRTPGAIALVGERERLTYAELERRANQLAHYLRARGVGAEVRVGLCLEKSPAAVTAVLGVLKAGGAYVPLDPAYPADRLAYMLQDASIEVLLTQEHLLERLPVHVATSVCLDRDRGQIAQESAEPPRVRIEPEGLAYIIYTSGTTGRPKGVQIPHGTLANAYRAWTVSYQLDQCASHLQIANIAFDVFTKDIMRSICYGAKLVLCPHHVLLAPERLYALMRREQVDAAEFVPAALRELVQYLRDTGQRLDFMRLLVAGADAWVAAEYEEIRRLIGPRTRCLNAYGVTECTIGSAFYEGTIGVPAPGAVVPIGRPHANTRLYILDRNLEPAPIGVPGDLHIGGTGVGRGYLNRTGLTAEKFIPDPFGAECGCRMYRTGDRARWLPSGDVEFLGRADHQVKVRGLRVELGEIEAVLRQEAGIQSTVVVAREERPGEKRLVAYIVPTTGNAPVPAALRTRLGQRLPDYMVPSAFVLLDALPLTPNGKVDRSALPAPAPTQDGDADLPPLTPVEELLAGLWTEILGVERVALDDDFFALGGHSLLAARLSAAIDATLDVELPLVTVFDAPTLRGLAARAEEALRAGRAVSRFPVEPMPRKGELPLSFAEERLWFLERLRPGSPGYIMPAAVALTGPLDQDALRRSVHALVERHEVLRSRFPSVRGRPVRLVDATQTLDWRQVTLPPLTPTSREAELRRLAAAEAARPFDVERGPLVRVVLVRAGEADHLLLLSLHHIVSDGWSIGVLTRELSELYTAYATGREAHLPLLRVQYADYACWQRALLSPKELEAELAWWSGRLAGLTHGAELAPDRPRPAVPTFAGSHFTTTLDPLVSADIRMLARAERATAFMVLLTIWKAVLRQHVQSDRVVVGTDVAGRPIEVMDLVGLFVNQLVLVTDLSGRPTLRELLARVRETTLSAYAHADVPFNLLVQGVNPIRDPSRNPLFQVMFVVDNTPERELHLAGVGARVLDFHLVGAPFDLSVLVAETEDGFRCMWRYNPDLFDHSTIERLADHFTMAAAITAAEPDIPLETLFTRLREADRQRRNAARNRLHEARSLRFGQMAAMHTGRAEGSEPVTE